jgi:cytochrome c oxidase subunit 4
MEGKSDKFVLFGVAGALLALLALTAGMAFINLGPFSPFVALTIAVAKALLVATFFMELRYSRHLLWVIAVAGVFWLLLLIGGTLADVVTRRLISPSVL